MTAGSAKVLVMPLGITLEVDAGETLLQAGLRSRIRWPSVCGGHANCTTCFVQVEAGIEAASPQSGAERERLEFAGRRGPEFRLACQMTVSGDMTVIKKGLKPPREAVEESEGGGQR